MEKMQNREKRLNFVLSLIVVLIYIFPFYILINVSLRNYTDLSSKGNKNRRGAGGHAPLYLNAVVAEGQRGNKRLLLLPVQTL